MIHVRTIDYEIVFIGRFCQKVHLAAELSRDKLRASTAEKKAERNMKKKKCLTVPSVCCDPRLVRKSFPRVDID